jgi:hypothetical protein
VVEWSTPASCLWAEPTVAILRLGYGFDFRGIMVRFPELALGPTQPPIHWVSTNFSTGVIGRSMKLLVLRLRRSAVMLLISHIPSWHAQTLYLRFLWGSDFDSGLARPSVPCSIFDYFRQSCQCQDAVAPSLMFRGSPVTSIAYLYLLHIGKLCYS